MMVETSTAAPAAVCCYYLLTCFKACFANCKVKELRKMWVEYLILHWFCWALGMQQLLSELTLINNNFPNGLSAQEWKNYLTRFMGFCVKNSKILKSSRIKPGELTPRNKIHSL
jgi:hypothetical protein